MTLFCSIVILVRASRHTCIVILKILLLQCLYIRHCTDRFLRTEKLTSTFLSNISIAFMPSHISRCVASQFFSGKPEGSFCLSCTFIFRNERNWMKKSARVSEKLVSPGFPGLQVATRLITVIKLNFCCWTTLFGLVKSEHCYRNNYAQSIKSWR